MDRSLKLEQGIRRCASAFDLAIVGGGYLALGARMSQRREIDTAEEGRNAFI